MIRTLTALSLAAFTALPVWAVELVMVEQPGCIYCERWDKEIAPAYPKTAEGEFAPLRRVDISVVEDSVTPQRAVVFTPTFLLVEDDTELGRLEGYPGAEFFWPMLNMLLRDKTEFEEPTE
ncbi:MAG: hypothetical protein ABJN39_14230 [Sulfitobacter sp.]|uniref:hypothetical protein n=1 Tax=unclassified Sulfitobacter TaxID=196795 RepID=UPI0029425432|nr:hypothetical protein [Sulfitobacter sp. LC.270.F.C4]WOI14464.1 hypothetical protein R1T45_15385 [Sulfitobacter sp. LC.270.F.C4]